jgi:hypothetical protein
MHVELIKFYYFCAYFFGLEMHDLGLPHVAPIATVAILATVKESTIAFWIHHPMALTSTHAQRRPW